MKRVALHSLGCKVNRYETDVMSQKLNETGYDIVAFDEEADIYIINTCSVTQIAEPAADEAPEPRPPPEGGDGELVRPVCDSPGRPLRADPLLPRIPALVYRPGR